MTVFVSSPFQLLQISDYSKALKLLVQVAMPVPPQTSSESKVHEEQRLIFSNVFIALKKVTRVYKMLVIMMWRWQPIIIHINGMIIWVHAE